MCEAFARSPTPLEYSWFCSRFLTIPLLYLPLLELPGCRRRESSPLPPSPLRHGPLPSRRRGGVRTVKRRAIEPPSRSSSCAWSGGDSRSTPALVGEFSHQCCFICYYCGLKTKTRESDTSHIGHESVRPCRPFLLTENRAWKWRHFSVFICLFIYFDRRGGTL